ncbi:GPN-loop GTPase 2 [Daktulosphaira vitifoliae]|uniref:GPN-loop GTPase 2 n=1 Tax=Daktulosphaira vitifoliae TaxID=58002 RepID=UPI0021AABCD8|nr:GPN-loop GTPase 2 [Daktulosphaira vitifoliae]XP_050540606.1 GPN-loop GTPase 2 [Daktulosphaira vitifoliae]XP_050540607.1 GPN-loop GTPase 2 [Daktulosphaira vitifoliae]
MPLYGQVVIGPPGSGKTTYCNEMSKYLTELGRQVAIVNIDPANDTLCYEAAVDVSDLITVEDVMEYVKLGPNGSLIYCIEFLEKRLDWLLEKLKNYSNYYILFDCPGQIEIYTHHNSMKNIMLAIKNELDLRLCCVQLIDGHYCSDPGKYLSALLMCTSTMYQMELPHVNILSKIDIAVKHRSKLLFNLDYYTEVLSLDELLNALQNDPLTARYHRLNEAIVSLIEGQNIVSFIPLNVRDKRTMELARKNIDKANGYVFNSQENKSAEMLNSVMQLDVNDFSFDILENVPNIDSLDT